MLWANLFVTSIDVYEGLLLAQFCITTTIVIRKICGANTTIKPESEANL